MIILLLSIAHNYIFSKLQDDPVDVVLQYILFAVNSKITIIQGDDNLMLCVLIHVKSDFFLIGIRLSSRGIKYILRFIFIHSIKNKSCQSVEPFQRSSTKNSFLYIRFFLD